MDATTLNTIVGILGGAISLAGIIIAIKSWQKKRAVTISTKEKVYVSPNSSGTFIFDYSNNDGKYEIGEGQYSFCTKWSKASNTSIHAYKDEIGIDSIALLKHPTELSSITSFEVDFSSRSRTPQIGDAIIWKNAHGNYAITKIISISDDTRGDNSDSLECEFVIMN